MHILCKTWKESKTHACHQDRHCDTGPCYILKNTSFISPINRWFIIEPRLIGQGLRQNINHMTNLGVRVHVNLKVISIRSQTVFIKVASDTPSLLRLLILDRGPGTGRGRGGDRDGTGTGMGRGREGDRDGGEDGARTGTGRGRGGDGKGDGKGTGKGTGTGRGQSLLRQTARGGRR